MYPATIVLKDELGEAYLPLPLHLLYQLEQPSMVGLVARNDVSGAAEDVVAVLHASDERVEFLAAVARGDHDGLTPHLAYGVEQLLHEYV